MHSINSYNFNSTYFVKLSLFIGYFLTHLLVYFLILKLNFNIFLNLYKFPLQFIMIIINLGHLINLYLIFINHFLSFFYI